jgi:glutamyl-tRNA synthetase
MHYLDDIFVQLDKLGIEPDFGPGNVDEHLKKFSQHQRIERYKEALSKLEKQDQLFNCACTRKLLSDTSQKGYPGICLHKNLPFRTSETAIRLKNEKGANVAIKDLWGNAYELTVPDSLAYCVLWRKDDWPAYQLTSVCDDTDMQINCIVRGTDLIPSSLFQILLSQKLGFDTFSDIRFLHHGLVMDSEGRKLSKSQASAPVKDLTKSEIMKAFISWAGWEIKTDRLGDLVGYASQNFDVLPGFNS